MTMTLDVSGESSPMPQHANSQHAATTPVITATDAPTKAADSTSLHTPLTLPSGFIFYEWETISIRQFNLSELKLLHVARTTQSISSLARAIGSTIDRDVKELTIGDFWYLMYWQRINSYKKAPFIIEYECEDEYHLKIIKEDGVSKDTLKNKHILAGNIKELTINSEAVIDHITDVHTEQDMLLFPCTMSDMIESRDIAESLSGEDTKKVSEEAHALDWLHGYASCINHQYGDTLAQRVGYLEKLSAENKIGTDFMLAVDKFNSLSEHGPVETVVAKCKECGHASNHKISIAAHQFFPSV